MVLQHRWHSPGPVRRQSPLPRWPPPGLGCQPDFLAMLHPLRLLVEPIAPAWLRGLFQGMPAMPKASLELALGNAYATWGCSPMKTTPRRPPFLAGHPPRSTSLCRVPKGTPACAFWKPPMHPPSHDLKHRHGTWLGHVEPHLEASCPATVSHLLPIAGRSTRPSLRAKAWHLGRLLNPCPRPLGPQGSSFLGAPTTSSAILHPGMRPGRRLGRSLRFGLKKDGPSMPGRWHW